MTDRAHRGAVPPDPTRQAAQRLLERVGRPEPFGLDFLAADVRLVAEAVMERNNQSIIGARSAENAETCASDAELADVRLGYELANGTLDDLERVLFDGDLQARSRDTMIARAHELARREAALQAEVVRLREALEGLAAADVVAGLLEDRMDYDGAHSVRGDAIAAALKEDA